MRASTLALALLLLGHYSFGQNKPDLFQEVEARQAARVAAIASNDASSAYRIGTDDVIEVLVFEVQELGGVFRVGAEGAIVLPLVGTVAVARRTPEQVAHDIEDVLRERYLKDPHVTVSVKEYVSQPVSVIGGVRSTGVFQLRGKKSLLDVLAMAGGVDSSAGNVIQIIRKPATPPQNPFDPEPGDSNEVISIPVEELFMGDMPELNVPVYGGDLINVLRAGSVFVIGDFVRPGEFNLKNGKLTVMQAVALAGGFGKDAKRKESRIIRYQRDGTREEVPVDVSKMLEGSNSDISLQANDILFVPTSKTKNAFNRTLETTISIISTRLIFLGR